MFQKIAIKNPGCRYCRYYVPGFVFRGKQTPLACAKGGRKLFQKQLSKNHRRLWKWTNCSYAREKNKKRFCADFKVQTIFTRLLAKIHHYLKNAGTQLPPSFKRDIWWNK